LFELIAEREFANPQRCAGAAGLIALLRTFSYVRSALSSEARAALERDVAALADRHCLRDDFELPWRTRLLLLRPRAAGPPPG
jgi:hypothetical protein